MRVYYITNEVNASSDIKNKPAEKKQRVMEVALNAAKKREMARKISAHGTTLNWVCCMVSYPR